MKWVPADLDFLSGYMEFISFVIRRIAQKHTGERSVLKFMRVVRSCVRNTQAATRKSS